MQVLGVLLSLPFVASILLAQTSEAGKRQFQTQCAVCHGADADGGEFGPGIVTRIPSRNDQELGTIIRSGLPDRGMPAFKLADPEIRDLVAFLRTLRPPRRGDVPARVKVQTTDGQTLEGLAVNQSFEDLQLRTDDQRVHLLRKAGERYRPVTSQSDWPTYDGDFSGNRYSLLKQIDSSNVARLAPKWIFTFADTSPLETTPVVVEGIMYVTSANQCYALDAGTGRQIWHFRRPRTQGIVGNGANGINRGVAVAGDRVFLATDHAHVIALNRFTGAVLWEAEMADWRQNYSATSAPLAIGNLVVSGMSGGDAGARGFVVAYDQATGKEAWRFWAAPKPGEPGSETWKGKAIEHPAAATWLNGTYDPQLDLLYWPTGNPGEDHNGDEREGDNLYSDSIVALDAQTGKLQWYYQFTPHDIWDWDAQEPLVLVDAAWQGQQRKLLIQANRNGFFYVLDRTNGKLLLAKPFVHKLTWAREIGPDGRPVLNPDQEPTPQGTRVCPALLGASNWWSTSFNPATGLYYVQTTENCSIYSKRSDTWGAGRVFMGGSTRQSPDDVPQKILRAIDIKTGSIAWELPQVGRSSTRGGTIATASGLVFVCEDSGALMAVDASTGKPLWHFQTSQILRASPMTYMFDGRQYVTVASGPNIISFGLGE